MSKALWIGAIFLCSVVYYFMVRARKVSRAHHAVIGACLLWAVLCDTFYPRMLVLLSKDVPGEYFSFLYAIDPFVSAVPSAIYLLVLRIRRCCIADPVAGVIGQHYNNKARYLVFVGLVISIVIGFFLGGFNIPLFSLSEGGAASGGIQLIAAIRSFCVLKGSAWLWGSYIVFVLSNVVCFLVFWKLVVEEGVFQICNKLRYNVLLTSIIVPLLLARVCFYQEDIGYAMNMVVYTALVVYLSSTWSVGRWSTRILMLLPSLVVLIWNIVAVQLIPFGDALKLFMPASAFSG